MHLMNPEHIQLLDALSQGAVILRDGRISHAVMEHPDLILPHPRMHLRRFVLKPLCDLDPALRHPILNQTVQHLLDHLEDAGQGIVELS